MPNADWTGKSAIICGASDGLGLEIAKQLCEDSISFLLLLARNRERLELVAAELQSKYPHCRISTLTVDMSDVSQVQQLVQQVTTQPNVLPKIDLLVQAVGKSDRGTLQDLTRSHLLELFDANLFTSLNAINELSPLMGNPSTLVLIGSLACHFAPRFLGGYAIAKHALAGLAQQSRLELAERGIHVLLASPGPIARSDAGNRYRSSQSTGSLPPEALQPGGGARLRGLEPQQLARDILKAAARHKAVVLYPAKARWLRVFSTLFPGLGDRLLRKNSS